ncbi:MAG TPA: DNA cytosine methyltransferase [Ktedonobacteraceae bacterium]|nr:DNA cytosine methyltransferase [Ktedonobacteraceae bacterium]
MEKPAQVSWLAFGEKYEESKPQNYFATLLRHLNVNDEIAGWPDIFGKALRDWTTNTPGTPIRILSLFSGGGGLDIAFHDAGFDAVQMVEIDPHYVETLKVNAVKGGRFEGGEPRGMDIREYDPLEELHIDFIIGGPPCQTFSAAGRRAAGVSGLDDPRGMLFQEYVRILRKLQPRGFLFENVAGIIGAQEGKAWREILAAFDSIGYTISYRVLDAAAYGVPQHRERLIIVGTRGKTFVFPRPTHGPDSRDNNSYYAPAVAIDGVGDEKPSILGGRYGHLLKDIPPGLNYSFYTEEMGHPTPHFSWRSKFSDLLYKADPTMPVRTIKAQGGQYTGPFHWENRSFSVGELKRLQTFPDDYAIVGGRLLAIQQIGNSVPPQFGRILAIAVLDQLFDIRFPAEIDYLSAGEELTFRQNKKLLTELYRQRAKEAIAKLYGTSDKGKHVLSKESSGTLENTKQQGHIAYLGPLFSWYVKDNQNQEYPWNIKYSIHVTAEAIHFLVGNLESIAKQPCIVIKVSPTQEWILPWEKVHLQIQEPQPLLITAAWKAFEHYIARQGFKADLVQLNGYYQYEPKIKMKVLKMASSAREEFPFWHWNILQQVLGGIGVRQIVSIQDLASRWNLSVEKTIDALTTLRSLGYEVRSEYTNNQIPTGHVLIPYAFPTFSPNSVQQRKVLFPQSFLEQISLLPANPVLHRGLWSPEQLSQSTY